MRSAMVRCSGLASAGCGTCWRTASRHQSSSCQSVSVAKCTASSTNFRAGFMPPRRSAPTRNEPPPSTKEPNSSHDSGQFRRCRISASWETSSMLTNSEQLRCCRRHRATTRSGEAPCLKWSNPSQSAWYTISYIAHRIRHRILYRMRYPFLLPLRFIQPVLPHWLRACSSGFQLPCILNPEHASASSPLDPPLRYFWGTPSRSSTSRR
jgi:hypothetical protein